MQDFVKVNSLENFSYELGIMMCRLINGKTIGSYNMEVNFEGLISSIGSHLIEKESMKDGFMSEIDRINLDWTNDEFELKFEKMFKEYIAD